jgi:hypothetical protein
LVFAKNSYFLELKIKIVTEISVDDTHIDRPIILETTKRSKNFCIKNPNLGIIICCDDPQRPTAKRQLSYEPGNKNFKISYCI